MDFFFLILFSFSSLSVSFILRKGMLQLNWNVIWIALSRFD